MSRQWEEIVPKQMDLFDDDFWFNEGGTSETTVAPHTHSCQCGTWVCYDEMCEPVGASPDDYGQRDCPFCVDQKLYE